MFYCSLDRTQIRGSTVSSTKHKQYVPTMRKAKHKQEVLLYLTLTIVKSFLL